MEDQKVSIDCLAIENTRQCNLSCKHCLRGEPEELNMQKIHLENFLKHVLKINTVIFSGGEPFLYSQAIKDFIEICEKNKIKVLDFYIATNGTFVNKEILHTLTDLYAFCSANEISRLIISASPFHDNSEERKKNLLKCFSFTDIQNEEDAKRSIAFYVKEGRAKENRIGTWPAEEETCEYCPEANYISGLFYLNCKGEVIAGCGFSYENQKDHILCKAEDFRKWLEEFKERSKDHE